MKKMKQILGLLVMVMACYQTCAQVAVSVELNRRTYHQYEPVMARVTLKNFSGTPLIFGANKSFKGELLFHIAKPGESFSRSTELVKMTLNNLILTPGVTKEVTINLGKSYVFETIGNHKMKAIVSHTSLTDKYESSIVGFDVSRGYKVWETSVGIPDVFAVEAGSKIAKRTYKVTSLFDGKDPVYYLMIQDASTIYNVNRIGNDLGVASPQFMVDNLSQLHIIVSNTVKSFLYHVYDSDGLRISTDEYTKTNSSPRFMEDTNTGKVLIVGGEKKVNL